MWAVVKPFLDSKTAAKFHLLGSDYQKTLLQYVDADQLPKELGGDCVCEGGCIVGPWLKQQEAQKKQTAST